VRQKYHCKISENDYNDSQRTRSVVSFVNAGITDLIKNESFGGRALL